MYPPINEAAKAALRTTTIELDPSTPSSVVRELLAANLIVEAPPASDGARRFRFTMAGARAALAVFVEDHEATPCRCDLPRSEHDARAPHAAFTGGCRAFTPARPLYSTRPPPPGDNVDALPDLGRRKGAA